MRWNERRRSHHPLLHQQAVGLHILQGHLAAKKHRQALQLSLAHGQAEEIVSLHKPPHIGQVLGERPARRRAAAEDPDCNGVAVSLGQTVIPEVVEHLDEIRALFGEGHGTHPVYQAIESRRTGTQGENFGQHGEAFLGRGGRRRSLAEKGAPGLPHAVQGSPQVHPSLVHFQHIDIQPIETGVTADLQVIRTGGRICRHLVIQDDPDTRIRENRQQTVVEHFHRPRCRDLLGLLHHRVILEQVYEGSLHDRTEVRQRGIAGVEYIRCRAIEIFGQ